MLRFIKEIFTGKSFDLSTSLSVDETLNRLHWYSKNAPKSETVRLNISGHSPYTFKLRYGSRQTGELVLTGNIIVNDSTSRIVGVAHIAPVAFLYYFIIIGIWLIYWFSNSQFLLGLLGLLLLIPLVVTFSFVQRKYHRMFCDLFQQTKSVKSKHHV